ncbi:tRNA lysidine(34) synthetase TilS [Beijerinckia sp. L45]|uniref:tRNA lysidine(34) synthetase TilS n=1 Tax=Beijerinckia sp. L45 TaxID=1641855 RepID=UPI00131E3D95|nr:tRNA lysidine(34) synthetase TilS [Beijerinckia sp. L45]
MDDGERVFAGLEDTPLLLAVSGGPDSLALMHLAARWGGAPLHVATVDHGLRANSAAEAEGVAMVAKSLGLPHAILPWLGPKPRTRIQERARGARYALLVAHAERIGAKHILTAHHADDQAETVLFRLGRGSGIAGLAGMRRETRLARGLTLVRPLLGHTKADLIAICVAAGQAFVDDPSNHDPAYARGTLRAQAPAAQKLGLDTLALTRLATRMARADEALEAEAQRCLGLLTVTSDATGFAAPLAPLAEAKPEILIRVLRHAIASVAPAAKTPRLDRLETLGAAIAAALRAQKAYRGTLSGTRVTLERDTMLTIVPEAARRRGRPAVEA